MAQLPIVFDPNDIPESDFAAIPSGDYVAVLIDSEIKPAKKNENDKIIHMSFQIVDGHYKDKVILYFLSIVHKNETAQRIALQNLAALQRAVGVTGRLANTDVLHNKRVVLRVEYIDAAKTSRGRFAENAITGFSAYEGQTKAAFGKAKEAVGKVAEHPTEDESSDNFCFLEEATALPTELKINKFARGKK